MKTYTAEKLNVIFKDNFLTKGEADIIFDGCEKLRWPDTSRRTSITFGDEGLIYTVKIRNIETYRLAKNWDTFPELISIKHKVEKLTGVLYNFCAILRYLSGDICIFIFRLCLKIL